MAVHKDYISRLMQRIVWHQPACADCVALLEQRGAEISMSRQGTPGDSAFCERFIGKFSHE